MESIIVACITGVVTLVGVILSNSKSSPIMAALGEGVLFSWKSGAPISRTHHF